MRHPRHLWWGIILIVLGALLLLDNMRVLDFQSVFRDYWPVLLILWGLSVLLRRYERRRGPGDPPPHESANVFGDSRGDIAAESIDESNVFGDVEARVTSQNFKGGSVSTVFGDVELDISAGGIADGEHDLRLSGVFGDLRLVLPRDTAFAIHGSTVFGDVRARDQRRSGIGSSMTYETPGYAAATKKVKIHASGVFGDISVNG